jgi:hypothetical protein
MNTQSAAIRQSKQKAVSAAPLLSSAAAANAPQSSIESSNGRRHARNEQKELCRCVRPTSDMMMLPSLPMPPPSSPPIHASCSNDSRLPVRRAPDWPHRHRRDLCEPSAWDCLRFSSLTLLWPALSVFGWSCTLHLRHGTPKEKGGPTWVGGLHIVGSWAAGQHGSCCKPAPVKILEIKTQPHRVTITRKPFRSPVSAPDSRIKMLPISRAAKSRVESAPKYKRLRSVLPASSLVPSTTPSSHRMAAVPATLSH